MRGAARATDGLKSPPPAPHINRAPISGASASAEAGRLCRRKVSMTPQERDLITTLLSRLKSAGTAGQQKDAEADALIRQAVRDQPDMPYYLVQTVLIQDLSLHQAQSRIAELEQQLAQAQSQKSSGTSFLGGLFGRSDPQPQQQEQPSGPWSRGPQVAPPQYGQGPGPGPGYAQQGYGQPGGYPPQG